MISVVIPTLNSERLLPRCFDSLIQAAVRGVVREVIVADGGSNDDTLAIADAAGAHIARAGRSRSAQLVAGMALARSDWLLFLHPGNRAGAGLGDGGGILHAPGHAGRPTAAVFRFAREEFGGEARRAEARAALRTALFALPYGDQGLLIPRRLYQKVGGYRALPAMEDADIVRRIGRRRLIRLRARAVNVAQPASQRTARRGADAAACAAGTVGGAGEALTFLVSRGMISTKLQGWWRMSSWDFRIPSQPSFTAPGRAGQGEQIGAARHPGAGARLHRRGADLVRTRSGGTGRRSRRSPSRTRF